MLYSALRAFLVAQTVKNLPAMQVPRVRSLGGEAPLEKGMGPHSSILPREIHGQWSLAGSMGSQRVRHS